MRSFQAISTTSVNAAPATPRCYLACDRGDRRSERASRVERRLYVLVHTPYLRPHHDWSEDVSGIPAADPGQAEADRRV